MSRLFVCPACDLEFYPEEGSRAPAIYCPECDAVVARRRRPDYDDRPRKKGMPTWAVVLLVIIGIKVGILVLVGGFALLMGALGSSQPWAPYQPPGGNCQVDMPGTPTPSVPKEADPERLKMYVCERSNGREAFLIGIQDDIDEDTDRGVLLNRMAQTWVNAHADRKELSRKLIWNGEYRGIESQVQMPEGLMIFRVHLTKTKAYMLVAIGPYFTRQSPDVVRFLESFKLTNVPDFKTPATDFPPLGGPVMKLKSGD